MCQKTVGGVGGVRGRGRLEAAATAEGGEGGSEGKGRRGEDLAGGGKVLADEVLVAERGGEREGGVLGDEF